MITTGVGGPQRQDRADRRRRFGLQAGVYTNDLRKAFYAIDRIDVGGVMINDTSIFRVDHMPYGGNKLSGLGREGVRFAVEEMTNIKMVMFKP